MKKKIKGIFADRIIFSVSLVFCVLVFFRLNTKTYFDDEIGSQFVLDKFNGVFDLYLYLNSWDVSPPLSYILLFFGKKIVTYQYIPILFLPLQLFCLIEFSKNTFSHFKFNEKLKFLFFSIIIINPTFLLWCTSLRWYTFWIPMSLYVLSIFYFKEKKKDNDILTMLIILSLMFHTSYLTILFVLSMLISNINFFLKDLKFFIKKNSIFFIILVTFNIPQLYFLITVHISNSQGQFGSYFLSFLYPMITIIFGNSVFPLEIISIVYLIFLSIIFFIYFKKTNLEQLYLHKPILIFFLTFFIILFISKMGFKPRHSAILNYLFLIFIFSALNSMKSKNKILKVFIFIIIIFNLYGLKNTLFQINTIKNNINLPVKKILSFVRENSEHCNNVNIYTDNLNLNYYFKREKNKNFIINKNQDFKKLSNYGCIFVIKSFSNNTESKDYKLTNFIYENYFSSFQLKPIYYDKFNLIKKKMFLKNKENDFTVKILY